MVTSIGGNACSSLQHERRHRLPTTTASYSVSGTVFYDAGGTTDGLNDLYGGAPDSPYANVPVYLWNSTGQLVGQTTTDANGDYSFGNLPNGTYTVSVDSNAPQLYGLTLSASVNPGYTYHTVTINNASIADEDFGFFALADYGDLPISYGTLKINSGAGHIVGGPYLGSQAPDVDTDGNPSSNATGDDTTGSPDDEDGVSMQANQYLIPGGSLTMDVTVSGSNGYLMAYFDWNNDGDFSDPGETVNYGNQAAGTRALTVKIPTGATVTTLLNARFRLYDATQVNLISPTGMATHGEVEDYQWPFPPTAVRLVRFEAAAQPSGILLTWETATEVDNLGFNLYRAESPDGPQAQVNDILIPSQEPGSPIGFVYTFLDEMATPGVTYYYWLEDVDLYGATTRHGPVSAFIHADAPFTVYLPTVVK